MAEWWEWSGEPGPWQSNEGPVMDWMSGGDVGAYSTPDYASPIGPGLGWDAGGYPTGAAGSGLSLEQQVAQAIAQRPDLYGQSVSQGAGGGGSSVLGALGSIGSFLGRNAGTLGPLLSGAGSLAGGAIGSNAANEAARLQAAALNRGLDLQTAQWLQSQAQQAPWLAAGQQALGHLTGRMDWAGPQQPGTPAAISGATYQLPNATPGWTPQAYQGPQAPNAGDYRWAPQQGPQAQDYRYTPGQTPDAATYRYTAGAVPTLSGQELLANDPGVQFRLDQGRKALEASAAARGGLLSGPTLAALQRQGQELSSQEYGQAWNRASQQAQLREGWAQAESQMGWQQAEAASRLREQVTQIASQQGWSQAQAEAVFREQMAQQASQQGYAQALAGQGQQFTQGLQGAQWNQGQQQQYQQELYNRMLEQQKLRYGMDVTQNTTDYQRQQQAYQNQVAELQRQWGNFAGVAGVGQTAANTLGVLGQNNATQSGSLLGQLGVAQATGPAASGNIWNRALTSAGTQIPGILAGLNA